jgi:hypothetical protein
MLKSEETKCFTYKVEMIIQIVSKDEVNARRALDQVGGHITARDVKLLDSVPLCNKEKEIEEKTTEIKTLK